VMEIHAPEAGFVQYTAAVGDEVPVGAVICQIVPEGPAAVVTAAAAAVPAQHTALPAARFTPLALSAAADLAVDIAAFPPGTLVRRDDVLRKAGKLPPEPKAPTPAKHAVRNAENAPVPGVSIEWSDLPRRKTVEARILGAGQERSIQSFVTATCRAPGLRQRMERLGLGAVGLNALVIFETARLLRKYPMFNAVHDRGRVGQYREVNVGWAVDGGQGLVVPVIPRADEKSLQEIAALMERHIEAYVESSYAPNDFSGATFTVSDLSGEGISVFQPLISQGQSAILGVGSDAELLYLTLAFDHQVTEGRRAAQFVRELAGRLEAHAANTSGEQQGSEYCAICQRDGDALRAMKAILTKSAIPPGFVCSICLSGY
jgi:pyruvate/2-oxoglutarate dehydrogenase complex dihydrolipoamide acyltransferase (E2) component